ncbi:hypothetical protein Goari_002575, partial [Gossypium aridum]|nr:hypothetical protein [Gossypium aridum]
AEDQNLETYILNLFARALRVIEEDLQEVGFLHVSHMLRGEYTITLGDVALQINLLVDRPIVTKVVDIGDWSNICDALVGKVLEKFFSSRIEMKWLEEIFNYRNNSTSSIERQQYPRAFILRLTGGILMQTIPPSPVDLEELHKVNLWGKTDKDWAKFHEKYINIWEHRYEIIPMPNLVLALELATSRRRPRRFRMNPKSGVMPPQQSIFFAPPLSPTLYYMTIPTTTLVYLTSLIILTFYPQSSYATSYAYLPIMLQTPSMSLFYPGGLSWQQPVSRADNIRWQPRTTPHSTKEKQDEDENEDIA